MSEVEKAMEKLYNFLFVNSEDIPIEISEALDKHFWDLVGEDSNGKV
jgi:hypothetical protein